MLSSATPTRKVEPPPAGWREPLRRVPAPLLLGVGIISVQVGAGFAARLFGTVSPAGITGLRLWAACLLLVAFGGRAAGRTVRGIVAERAWRDAAIVVAFGLTLGVMNFAIYQSFARIPLGIAVTIEFLGPLGVAVATSRRLIDLAWVALAAIGVTLLGTAGVGAATFDGVRHGGSVLAGVSYALVAAASWACYIMLSTATGKRFSGSSGLVIAIVIGALVITPVAVASAGASLFRPGRARRRAADRPALLGGPLPVRARGAAPGSGPGVRDLDEPGAGRRRAGRRRAAEPAAVGAAVAGHRLRDGGDRRRGASTRPRAPQA